MGDRKQPNPAPGEPGYTGPPQRRPDPPPAPPAPRGVRGGALELLADAIVADLFMSGSGPADRLRLEAGGLDLGGWSRVAVRARVLDILEARL